MSTASDYPNLRPRLDWVTITLGPDGKDLPSYELIQWGPPDVWVRPRWFRRWEPRWPKRWEWKTYVPRTSGRARTRAEAVALAFMAAAGVSGYRAGRSLRGYIEAINRRQETP